MLVVGGRSYVEIPGDRTHELPPLLLRGEAEIPSPEKMMSLAEELVESDDLVPGLAEDQWVSETEAARRKMDMALNLVETYYRLLGDWQWGDSVLEWIRQCEITFETTPALRGLLRPDVWPHAGRKSFVMLLEDKAVTPRKEDLERAVGMRLTFRQPPPLSCVSDQFLFYLKGTLSEAAYNTWAGLTPEPVSSLPPERFHFRVVKM